MNKWLVQFNTDSGIPEEYYYNNESDARHHFDLFRDDDSELYTDIELISPDGKLIDTIFFVLPF